MQEIHEQFEQRKKDHIRIALDPKMQTEGASGLERVELVHEALPEINFSEIKTSTKLFGHNLKSPIFISSMTAGHLDGVELNLRLARAAQEMGWAMGVGSQRRELYDSQSKIEWKKIRSVAPEAVLFGNLGLTQVIQTPVGKIQELIENLQASALFVHTNPLQEVLQKEGTPNFRGGLEALKNLSKAISVPVILKEVGCGFSKSTIAKLLDVGIYALDVAGTGGTHWGRIEGQRSTAGEQLNLVAENFKNWGISTLDSMINAKEANGRFKIWASGGIRSGLDVAKLLALGAEMVGVAMPMLQAAVAGDLTLLKAMQQFEYELQVAMFCTGCEDIQQLREKKVWSWK